MVIESTRALLGAKRKISSIINQSKKIRLNKSGPGVTVTKKGVKEWRPATNNERGGEKDLYIY